MFTRALPPAAVHHQTTFAPRGFTLVELLVSIGVSAILMTAFASVFSWHTSRRLYNEDYLQAQQEALGVIVDLHAKARMAAYSFPFDGNGTGSEGIAPFPLLDDLGESGIYSRGQGQFPGMLYGSGAKQELAITYGAPAAVMAAETIGNSLASASSPSNPNSHLRIAESSPLRPTFRGGPNDNAASTTQWCIISGACAESPTKPFSMVQMATIRLGGGSSSFAEAELPTLDGLSAPPALCASGLAPGFRILPKVTHVYQQGSQVSVPKMAPGLRRLLLNSGESATPVQASPNVEDFSVRYGFDLSDPVDGRLDPCPQCVDDPFSGAGAGAGAQAWCSYPSAADLGGPCRLTTTSGEVLPTGQLLRRVVAIHVTFNVRSAHSFAAVPGAASDADGHRRWSFSTTVALRNRQVI